MSIQDKTSTSTGLSETNMDSLVLMEFTGIDTNSRTLRSRFRPSDKYRYSFDESHFNAYRADVPWLISLGIFKVVEESLSESPLTNELLPLESHTTAPDFNEIPIDVLPIDSIILANLKKNDYTTLGRVRMASDGELLSLKGMGDKRLKDLRNALNTV